MALCTHRPVYPVAMLPHACAVWFYTSYFLFGCFLSCSSFFPDIGLKHNSWKNLFDPLVLLMDRQSIVHQIVKYCCFWPRACYVPVPPLHLAQKCICTFCFDFSLIAHLLALSFVLTRGFNHVGNSRTDGPRGVNLKNMLTQSNNLQLLKRLVWSPLQVYIPAASSFPGLMLIWLCGELIQLAGWTESTKE